MCQALLNYSKVSVNSKLVLLPFFGPFGNFYTNGFENKKLFDTAHAQNV
jgi:hypothetical protein